MKYRSRVMVHQRCPSCDVDLYYSKVYNDYLCRSCNEVYNDKLENLKGKKNFLEKLIEFIKI